MKRFLVFTLFLTFFFLEISNAQYAKDDYELIKASFTREFDSDVITNYLKSGDIRKEAAALLTIAQSDDKEWIESILSLSIDNHPLILPFTLGKLGRDDVSADYLYTIVTSTENDTIRKHAMIALGNCGNGIMLDLLSALVKEDRNKYAPGYALSLLNFAMNNLLSPDGSRILSDIILDETLSVETRANAMMMLVRFYDPHSIYDMWTQLVTADVTNDMDVSLVRFTLSAMNKIDYFPYDRQLLGYVVHHDIWNIRAAACATLTYYPYKEVDELNIHLGLFSDENPNVVRNASVAVRNIRLEPELNTYLVDSLISILSNSDKKSHTSGELFLSLLQLSDSPKSIFEMFASDVLPEYRNRGIAQHNAFFENPAEMIIEQFDDADTNNKLEIMNSLLQLKNELQEKEKVYNFFYSQLQSAHSPIVSLACEGIIDSVALFSNEELSNIITTQVKDNLSNSDFLEAHISLLTLAKGVSEELHQEIVSLYKESGNYALQYLTGMEGVQKTTEQFDDFWENAFKYQTATILTDKGAFKVVLLPQLAPISVGNFCKLAKEGYYDNVLFHRVVPGFVIQAGDPTGTGWGGPGYEIVSEYSPFPYEKGTLGMASAGKNTEGSQWFVMHEYHPHLNGRYTVWAKIYSGQFIVDLIEQDDKIIKITLE